MRKNTVEDFWARVERTESCWNWTSYLKGDGYGDFTIAGVSHYAHRYSYVLNGGEIPPGYQMDHLCRNRRCVRPDHLEPVSQQENIRRGAASYALRTVCRAGLHDITRPDSVHIGSHGRQCAECRRASARRYRERQRAIRKEAETTGGKQK